MVANFTVVVAKKQTNGKGQRGAVWTSEAGKNLTFSVFVDIYFLPIAYQFYFNCAVALAIYNGLDKLNIPKLSLKWPNDILSANKKIAGVLIENTIRFEKKQAIVGIGLNVNQTEFSTNLNASSLKNSTGIVYNLDEVLQIIITELKLQITRLREKEFLKIHQDFEAVLFRKNKPSTFKNAEGDLFMGFIKGVSNTGKLQLLIEDGVVKEYRLKEVQLLY